MSNRTSEETFEGSLSQLLDFVWKQWRKEIYTCMPGVVKEYDAETRRATVQPLLRMVATDGTPISRVEIEDVPVIQPSGGGYAIHVPLKEDDDVLIVYAMRDIGEFKETYLESTPIGGILAGNNAIAIAGFGSMLMEPVDPGAVVIQKESGDPYILLKEDKVELKRREDKVVIDDSGIELKSDVEVRIRAPRVRILRG